MSDALLLTVAALSAFAGMAWLALAMDVHWEQVRRGAASRTTVVSLRVLGAAALAVSLAVCLAVDHVSMASLVWIMCVAASGLLVTFTLATRPRWLAPLVMWVPGRAAG